MTIVDMLRQHANGQHLVSTKRYIFIVYVVCSATISTTAVDTVSDGLQAGDMTNSPLLKPRRLLSNCDDKVRLGLG